MAYIKSSNIVAAQRVEKSLRSHKRGRDYAQCAMLYLTDIDLVLSKAFSGHSY